MAGRPSALIASLSTEAPGLRLEITPTGENFSDQLRTQRANPPTPAPNAAGPASPWRDRAGVVAAQPMSADGSDDIAEQLSVTRDRGPRDIP